MIRLLVVSLACVTCILGYPNSPKYSNSYSSVHIQKPTNRDLQFQSYLIDPRAIDKEKNLIPSDEEPFEDDTNTTTTELEITTTTETTTVISEEERKNSTNENLQEKEEEGSGFNEDETAKINAAEEMEIKKVLEFESSKTNNTKEKFQIDEENTDSPTTTEMYVEVIYPHNIDVNKKSIPAESTNDIETTTVSNLSTEEFTTENKIEMTTETLSNSTEPSEKEIEEREPLDTNNEIDKEAQPNYELAEEFEVKNVNNNGMVNNFNPPYLDFFYYIYNPSGYFRRLTTYDEDNSQTLSESSQYRFENVEPIRELSYTSGPKLLVLQRLRNDI